MKSFFEKESYSLEDIQSLIDNEVEESVYLDFKQAEALDISNKKSDKVKEDIVKDVTAFANSDGGVIVYGVKEEKNKANQITPVDGNKCNTDRLTQIINTARPTIEKIEIFPIRIGGDISNSIYVVKIPRSLRAPHMSKDHKYYKRHNCISTVMEEYEVRDTFGRTVKPELSIFDATFEKLELQTLERLYDQEFRIDIKIKNIGRVIAKEHKIEIIILGDKKIKIKENDFTITQFGNKNPELEERLIKKYIDIPLFPEEVESTCIIDIWTDRKQVEKLLSTLTITVKLRYEGGSDSMDITIPSNYKGNQ